MTTEIQLAGCIIPDEQGRILLIHRYGSDKEQWEIPGGKIEDGETAEIAATRELKEELGVELKIVRCLGEASFEQRSKPMHYTWFLAVTSEQPSIQEPSTFDKLDYFFLHDLGQIILSQGATCFVSKLDDGTITL